MSHKLLIMSLIFSITGNNCYAATPNSTAPIVSSSVNSSVLYLQKGTEAPFEGYLFPPDKALEFRKELIELDSLRAMQPSYEKSIDLYKKNEDVLLEQNNKLSEALAKTTERSVWENRIWFALGILVTGAAVWGASKLK